MILCDWQLSQYIDQGYIIVTPYDKSLVNPASLDIRLGNQFTTTNKTVDFIGVDPTDKESFQTETLERDEYWLEPGGVVLASMLEDITLPANISAKLFGKSSLARLGLDNSALGAWVDAGWSGVLTMEFFNQQKFAIKLTPGMKCGQLVFFEHQSASKPYKGRYSKQTPGMGSLGI